MGDATTRPRRLRPALIALAALAAVVAVAWTLQAVAAGGAGTSKDAPAPYSIEIRRGGETVKKYDLAALRALSQHTAVLVGREQTGPLLSTVLDDAGAVEYDVVVVRGAGVRDSGRLKLTAAQVREGVQLDYSQRGTVKVCGPELVWPAWVRDVLTISVD